MDVIFANRRQALKVRLVLWASVLAAAGAIYGAVTVFETFGLNPGDGGVLRPLGERLAMAGLIAAFGLLFAGGMMLFASLYVLRVARAGDRIEIDTMAPWGAMRRVYTARELGGGEYYHGRLITPKAQFINAPWITLRATGRRLPFILDLQAEEIDEAELRALMARAPGVAAEPTA